jgi:E3 ubiquitin-protein ligase ATL41
MSFAHHFDVNLLLVAVTALLAAVAFVAALHLYARCYLRPRRSGAGEVAGEGFPNPHQMEYVWGDYGGIMLGGGNAAYGLDDKALRALPVFTCESNEQAGKGGVPAEPVRCAVCLGPMVDGELGKLLPACRHVFHVECIDSWLRMSATCPVCRTTAAADAPSGEEVQPRAAG